MKKTFLLLTLLLPSLNLLAMSEDDHRRVLKSAPLSPSVWSNKRYAQLSGLKLPEINLQGENLAKAQFEYGVLTGAFFQNANLADANFKNATLRDVNFRNADLSNADFTEAKLEGAFFQNANLAGANFKGTSTQAIVEDFTHFSETVFANATCDEETTLPMNYACTDGKLTKKPPSKLDRRKDADTDVKVPSRGRPKGRSGRS